MSKVLKSVQEWKSALTELQFEVTRKKELNAHLRVSTGIPRQRECMHASAVVRSCLIQRSNMIPEPVGLVFSTFKIKIL